MTRKYRQRGYQDDDGDRDRAPKHEEKSERGPREGYGPREPRKINMPGFREVLKCTRCGTAISTPIAGDSQCPKCASDLHSCAQCAWFDTGRRYECSQPVPDRVSPKDARNTCSYFGGRVTVERETRSTGPPSARQAFNDLFK